MYHLKPWCVISIEITKTITRRLSKMGKFGLFSTKEIHLSLNTELFISGRKTYSGLMVMSCLLGFPAVDDTGIIILNILLQRI